MNVPCLTSCGWWEAHGILSKWFSGLRYGLYWTWPEAGSINSCMSRNGVDHSDADHVNSTPSYLALSATMRTASSADSAYTRVRQSSMNRPKNAMRGSSCGLSIDSKYAPYKLAISGKQAAPIGTPRICSYVLESCLMNKGDFTANCIHVINICLSWGGNPVSAAYFRNIFNTMGIALLIGMF